MSGSESMRGAVGVCCADGLLDLVFLGGSRTRGCAGACVGGVAIGRLLVTGAVLVLAILLGCLIAVLGCNCTASCAALA